MPFAANLHKHSIILRKFSEPPKISPKLMQVKGRSMQVPDLTSIAQQVTCRATSSDLHVYKQYL